MTNSHIKLNGGSTAILLLKHINVPLKTFYYPYLYTTVPLKFENILWNYWNIVSYGYFLSERTWNGNQQNALERPLWQN